MQVTLSSTLLKYRAWRLCVSVWSDGFHWSHSDNGLRNKDEFTHIQKPSRDGGLFFALSFKLQTVPAALTCIHSVLLIGKMKIERFLLLKLLKHLLLNHELGEDLTLFRDLGLFMWPAWLSIPDFIQSVFFCDFCIQLWQWLALKRDNTGDQCWF